MERGKLLCYSDLISDLTVYIGVHLRGPSHRGASQLGFPQLVQFLILTQMKSRNIHTVLMPDPEAIEQSADAMIDWIKTNLARCIQANEIRYTLDYRSVA